MSRMSEWEIGSEIMGRDIYLKLKGFTDSKFSHSFLSINDAEKFANQILLITKNLKELSCGKCFQCNKYMKYKNINEDNLIYEETVSPNEYYVSSDEEKVFYTIKIYKKNNTIIVKSSSNTSFTKELQYEINYEQEITKDDIKIEWTTLMGDSNYTKENQIAVAIVTLSHNGEIFSQRKISFVSNAIDIIVDAVSQ